FVVGNSFTETLNGWQADGPDFGDKIGDNSETKMKVAENSRIMALSLIGTEIWRSFWRIPCDRTPPHVPVPDAITATESVGWTWGGRN
ncbi:hypothetical protein AVEN_148253-1, partial [Araneus ventricosus]